MRSRDVKVNPNQQSEQSTKQADDGSAIGSASPQRTGLRMPFFAKCGYRRQNRGMAKAKKRASKKLPRLRPVVSLGDGFVLATTARRNKVGAQPRESETASVLVKKIGQALQTPGISRNVVFPKGIPGRLYTYSVDPDDPSRILRKARDGSRSVGHFIDGRFRAR